MSDGSWWIEIVFLAMLAGFIALRLVSVLGRRTGHEKPAGEMLRGSQSQTAADVARLSTPLADASPRGPIELPADTDPALRGQLQAIADADPRFDPERFLDGAKVAYRMILEAFWKGDQETLDGLIADDVALQFRHAITARNEEGLTLENRLVHIERAVIAGARLHGMMAEITVRFDADLVAVTRDKSGRIVAGSTSDAVATHDVWTFSRHVAAQDPNWLLIETDEG